MGSGCKYIIACLGILDITGVNSNIGHHVIKVADNKIGKITLDISYKAINQNANDDILL